MPNFMKIRPVGAKLFHADGHDEDSRFSQFSERAPPPKRTQRCHPRTGRPSTSSRAGVTSNNRRLTTEEVAHFMHISNVSAHEIIHKTLFR
jgi:hypothetical protein